MALTESKSAVLSDFLAWELDKNFCREAVTVLSGQNLLIGAVVGKVAAGSLSESHAGNTGSGAMSGLAAAAGVQPGVYTVQMVRPVTDLGDFMVYDPKGDFVAWGTVGTAFSNQIGFTIADATDFVAGDKFLVTVAAGTGKVKEYNPSNTDGSGTPVGIAIAGYDASGGDKKGVIIVRSAIVKSDYLVWFSGASAGQKTAALAILKNAGILAQTSV